TCFYCAFIICMFAAYYAKWQLKEALNARMQIWHFLDMCCVFGCIRCTLTLNLFDRFFIGGGGGAIYYNNFLFSMALNCRILIDALLHDFGNKINLNSRLFIRILAIYIHVYFNLQFLILIIYLSNLKNLLFTLNIFI
ncbi:hypothetical protein ACJX0J_024079, partial [Zea mays]